MSEYIIKLPNGGAADECIRLRGYEKSLYGYELHEEIVRCRDCKYANEDGDECVYFAAWEPLPEGDEFRDVYVDVEPDGFCAWGERREP